MKIGPLLRPAAALSMALLTAGQTYAKGEGKLLPTCLAGVCVGEHAPTEAALKSRFGGQAFTVGYRTRAYCYELKPQTPQAHLLFILKDFGDGWRVVTIRVADRPVCAKPFPLTKSMTMATSEGVVLGGPARSVRAIYGASSHTIDPQSRDLSMLLDSKGHKIDTVLQYVPLDGSIALSAIFIMAANRIVAIEISSDV